MTVILEIIYFLSRVKSFRTPKVQHVIQHKAPSLMVTAKTRYSHKRVIKTGIEKSRTQTVIHNNGKSIKVVSEKAKNLPLIIISPDTNSLAAGTPKQRRHWLDWAMFHVEPSYLDNGVIITDP